jgi:Uma2 family endonuclease
MARVASTRLFRQSYDGLYQSLGLFQGEQLIQSRLVPGEAVPAAQSFDWAGGLL